MSTPQSETKFDIRTLERFLREGKITQKEFEKFLKELPDESNKKEEVAVFEEPTEESNSEGDSEPTFSA